MPRPLWSGCPPHFRMTYPAELLWGLEQTPASRWTDRGDLKYYCPQGQVQGGLGPGLAASGPELSQSHRTSPGFPFLALLTRATARSPLPASLSAVPPTATLTPVGRLSPARPGQGHRTSGQPSFWMNRRWRPVGQERGCLSTRRMEESLQAGWGGGAEFGAGVTEVWGRGLVFLLHCLRLCPTVPLLRPRKRIQIRKRMACGPGAHTELACPLLG